MSSHRENGFVVNKMSIELVIFTCQGKAIFRLMTPYKGRSPQIDSAQAIRVSMTRDNHPEPLLCPYCSKPMKLVRTISHVPGIPEILAFYCSHCEHAETRVQQAA